MAWRLAAALALGLLGTLSFFVLARQEANRAKIGWGMAESRRVEAEALSEDLKRLKYAHLVGLAQAEWDANNARIAWDHLESTDRNARGWEYRYLQHLFDPSQRTLTEQGIEIRSMAFRPDGKYLAGPGGDNTVKVWDALTGRVVASLPHTVEVNTVAFSADGRLLATGGTDTPGGRTVARGRRRGEIKLWDAETFAEMHVSEPLAEGVWCVAFDPSSRLLAAASGHWTEEEPGSIKVWDATTWQELKQLRGHEKCVTGVAFCPNGQLASASRDGTVRLWDVAAGQQLGSPLRTALAPNRAVMIEAAAIRLVRNVAVSPNGDYVAAAYWDGTIRIWNEWHCFLLHKELCRGAIFRCWRTSGTRVTEDFFARALLTG